MSSKMKKIDYQTRRVGASFNCVIGLKICNIRFLDPDMKKNRNNFSVNNIYCVIKYSQTTQLYITKVFYIQFN
jgi:hypothetical protein